MRRVAEQVTQAKRITILIHRQPDGDAIGSAVALGLALAGKNTRLVCATSPLPLVFQNIVGSKIKFQNTLPDKSDLLIILDCADSTRTGFAETLKKSKTPIILIDHHEKSDLAKLASAEINNQKACATAELVSELLDTMRCSYTPAIAQALLLGIFTDTGGFKHPNTSSQTLRLASRLIRYGGNLPALSQAFSFQLSTAKKRLWGRVLSEVRVNRLGIVTATVSQQLLSSTDCQAEDLSGLANLLALTYESKAALVLLETADGWRGILRTRHRHINIGQLARYFGGKGQQKAAGFTATKELISGTIKPDN